jgi:hypothetical protein
MSKEKAQNLAKKRIRNKQVVKGIKDAVKPIRTAIGKTVGAVPNSNKQVGKAVRKTKTIINNLQKPKKFRKIGGKNIPDYSWDIEKIWKQGTGGS